MDLLEIEKKTDKNSWYVEYYLVFMYFHNCFMIKILQDFEMDGIKDEPPVNEDEDDGRGAWNTVHLGILLLILNTL